VAADRRGTATNSSLFGFLHLLQTQGFSFGIEEMTRALTMFRILELERRVPATADQLAALIGPAVCSSPQEQEEFRLLLAAWLESPESEGELPSIRSLERAGSERAEPRTDRHVQRNSKWWFAWAALLVLGVATVELTGLNWPRYLPWISGNYAAPATKPPPTVLRPVGGVAPPVEDSQSGSNKPPSMPVSPAPRPPAPVRPPVPVVPKPIDQEYVFDELKLRRIALAAAPLFGCVALWIFILRWRHLYIRRHYELRDPATDRLRFPFSAQELFGSSDLSPDLRRLRRSAGPVTSRIDYVDTVNSTARAAGSPVIRYFRDEREIRYLLLFDRHSSSDHQSMVAGKMVERLQRERVDLIAFEYFGTLLSLRQWRASDASSTARGPATGDVVPLKEVLDRFPRRVVIIFGNPASLRGPNTYELHPGLGDLLERRHRILVCSSPRSLPEAERQFLHRYGFHLLEGSSEGLLDLVRLMAGPQSDMTATAVSGTGSGFDYLPPSLRRQTDRWLLPLRPSESEIESLLAVLRAFLGVRTFAWLCATAVYPTVDPELTRALGVRIRDAAGQPLFDESGYLRLSQLPWFRVGQLPDWLRERLVADIRPQQRLDIRDEIQTILIKGRGDDRSGKGANIVIRATDEWSAVLRILLRGGAESSLEDPVFQQFMEIPGPRAALTGVARWPVVASLVMSLAASAAVWAALKPDIRTIVVIILAGHSFDNLYGDFPGAHGLSEVIDKGGRPTGKAGRQRERDGETIPARLPPIWGGITSAGVTVFRSDSNLANAPFALENVVNEGSGERLSSASIIREMTDRFFEHQMQINGGANDKFAAWSDAGGLPMGYFNNSHSKLYALAWQYVLADEFFQGAFGGGFLNSQYLICACAPEHPNVGSAKFTPHTDILETAPNGAFIPRLKVADSSPRSAFDGAPVYVRDGSLAPGDYFGDRKFYAVDTVQPPYQPSGNPPASGGKGMLYADPASASTLPPQSAENIGDLLTAKRLSWKWYAGAWTNAVEDGRRDPRETRQVISTAATFSIGPQFQPHVQPFNYFERFDPGKNEAKRNDYLKDYADLIADIDAGKLPNVVFYVPQGTFSQHGGYANLDDGDEHAASLVRKLQDSSQWRHMVIIVTYNHFGGTWDHLRPPRGDKLGPGTRVPTIIISPFAKRRYIDHTQYDSGSILRFISRVFGLRSLYGLNVRDASLQLNREQPMGDLTRALDPAVLEYMPTSSKSSVAASPQLAGTERPPAIRQVDTPSAPPNQGNRYWIYLGGFRNGAWEGRKLNLPDSFKPNSFDPKTDPNRGIYQVQVDMENVHYGSFSPSGSFPPRSMIVRAGQSVTLLSTAQWFDGGEWWATIAPHSRAVQGTTPSTPPPTRP
jgi:acid phosphatase